MYDPSRPLPCPTHQATQTRARCWTLYDGSSKNEDLCDADFSHKIADIESTLQAASRTPTFYLITARGDPYKSACPIEISNQRPGTAHFDSLNRLLGVNTHAFAMYATLRPQCSYYYEYDDSMMHLRAIVLLVRMPTNTRAIVFVMRLQISNLSCVSLVCCARQEDLDEIRLACETNKSLLTRNPLGLLSITYDLRARLWEGWIMKIWLAVNTIEGHTKSAPPEWLMKNTGLVTIQQMASLDPAIMALQPDVHPKDFIATPLDELTTMDKLLPRLYTTDTEISHGTNVMSFAMRYGTFCLDAVKALGVARQSVGLPLQPPGARAMVQDRIRSTQSRCYALQDRFAEIRERHRSQINASISLIAHRESKISMNVARLVANDSRTMKTIGVMTLVFLPATLVTSLWQANVFHLDAESNWKVYSSATIAVTAFVFLCWWTYMHFSRRDLHQFAKDHIPGPDGEQV